MKHCIQFYKRNKQNYNKYRNIIIIKCLYLYSQFIEKAYCSQMNNWVLEKSDNILVIEKYKSW